MKQLSLTTVFFIQDENIQKELKNLLAPFHSLTIVKVLHTSSEVLEFLNHSKPDLFITDISSLSLIHSAPKPPFLILIDNVFNKEMLKIYLDDGFFDILYLPINEECVNNMMSKILNIYYRYNPDENINPQCEDSEVRYNHQQISESLCNNQYLFINGNRKIGSIKIYYHEIKYISSVGNELRVFLENGIIKYVRTTLKSFQKKLPENTFAKINRSTVVNLDKVMKVYHKKVTVGTDTFTVSRPFFKNFAERLKI